MHLNDPHKNLYQTCSTMAGKFYQQKYNYCLTLKISIQLILLNLQVNTHLVDLQRCHPNKNKNKKENSPCTVICKHTKYCFKHQLETKKPRLFIGPQTSSPAEALKKRLKCICQHGCYQTAEILEDHYETSCNQVYVDDGYNLNKG